MDERDRSLLTRLERYLVFTVSVALVLVTVANTVLMARGHAVSLYLKTRDVAVIALATTLVAGNVAALRRNPRQGQLFLIVLALLAVVGVAHAVRLLHGGFPCR